MLYHISTKDVKKVYDQPDHFQAIKQFFIDVKNGSIKLDQIGMIGLVKYRGLDKYDQIPFRTTPSLYSLGLINHDTLMATMSQFDQTMTRDEITKLILADGWMTDAMIPGQSEFDV